MAEAYRLRWNDSGYGTLVLADAGTSLGEMMEHADEAALAFWYWLYLTESHGEVEDVFV